MVIKCIAVDDEPLALKKICSFIEKVSSLELVKTFDNALDVIPFLNENNIDLMFLDIQMEKFTGIQFLEAVKFHPQVVITTAYEEYALKGYDLSVSDYLLKPYSFERFVQAVNKVMDNLKPKIIDIIQNERNYFFVKTEYRLEKVYLDEILYVEGMRDYLQIVTPAKRIMTLLNFKFIETKLFPPQFQRVHKSFLVAVNHIESIERNMIKVHDRLIPVSSTYKEDLFKLLKIS